MRLLLAFILQFSLGLALATPSGLELQINGKKTSIPFWTAQGAQSHGAILLVQGGPFSDGGYILLSSLAELFAKKGWSVAIFAAGQQGDKTPWIDNLPEAMASLRKKGGDRLVLLHYGDQLKPLIDYFNKPQSKRVNGLALLSAFQLVQDKDSDVAIEKIPFPLVDIIGQFDYATVIEQAARREQNKPKQSYIQREIPGANHDYDHQQILVVAYLHAWMMKLKSNSAATPPIVLTR